LISPNEWNREHIGSFRLDSNQKWIKLWKIFFWQVFCF
jgi:hypothetical protein